MKKGSLLLILLCITSLCLAQNQAANWYFGYGAGIQFDLARNIVVSNDLGQLNTNEGCASISDDTGQLLFYTDGTTVWNRSHAVMQNGFGLFGDASSSQSAIIVPQPNNEDVYYIFTVDNALDGVNRGLNYSIVDMSLDNSFGAVTVKNRNLLAECSEKITAVLKDCRDKSIWVITFASEDGSPGPFTTFHAYEVTDRGLTTVAIKSTFSTAINDLRGYLKLSPDGSKMACANMSQGLYLYDFDVLTGIVSNEQRLAITNSSQNSATYGIEFSPSSQLLYVHSSNDFFGEGSFNPTNHSSSLTQFDLTAPSIQGSEFELDNRQLYRGALQLGPDGKIYRALSATYTQGISYLGVINNPDAVGATANYQHNAIRLSPNSSSQGLPPFIQSFFNKQIDIIKNGENTLGLNLCEGETYTLESEDIFRATYTWYLNGSLLPETDFDLVINQGGHYEVIIDPNNGDCIIEGQAFVNMNPLPRVFPSNLLQCDEDGTLDGLTSFNLNEANETITNNTASSTYFYLDLMDAQANNTANALNPIGFNNTSNPQTIYVSVVDDNTGCFSATELTLEVSVTDAFDSQLIACDDDSLEDGFYAFNLIEAVADITLGLPSGLEVSFYETYENALLEQNSLGNIYTNAIPYNQVIYARVENNNNCYGISNIELIVRELPEIITEDVKLYCLNWFPQSIPIDGAIINDSPENYTYNWSTGENTYEIQINTIGNYNVVVTNANGCSKERNITINPSNIATFQSIEVVDASENNTITVLVSGEGIYEFALFDKNNNLQLGGFQSSNVFENVFPGIYTIQVRDIKNDCGIVNDLVSVIGFPKYFTPNNDGYNDTWQIYGVSDVFQPNSQIRIYNRYGKLLKQISPTGKGWDGTFNGELLPNDDYWFTAKLQDGRSFRNHFSLKR